MSIYKAFNHQHVPEIRESLKQTQGYLDAAIDFIPYRGDFARGIFATEVVKTDKPIEEIVAGYKEFYKDAKFTHYVDKAIDLKQVVNTNKCLVHVDKYGDKLLITSCIDNLLKRRRRSGCSEHEHHVWSRPDSRFETQAISILDKRIRKNG